MIGKACCTTKDAHSARLITAGSARAHGLLALLCCTALLGCYGPVETPPKPTVPPTEDGKHDLERWLKSEANDIKKSDIHDPAGKLSREDYYNLFFKNNKDTLAANNGNKPKLMLPGMNDLMMAPEAPTVPDDKLVTLMVTDDVPLKDVLVELARRADVDMEIDPQITGGIILSARDKPFSEVISRVAALGDLKYSFEGGVLKVSRDLPEIHNYRMNLLNMVRTSQADVKSGTSLGGGAGGEGGANSGSNNEIKAVADQTDMWAMVQDGITNILSQYRSAGAAAAAAAPAAGSNAGASVGIISLNRQAGLISVMATEKQGRAIKEYLDTVHMAQSAQVLIEAKVMEVTLDDEYRSGINWNFLNGNVTGLTAAGNFSDLGDLGSQSSQTFTAGILPTELFGFDNTSIDATIELVEKFGSTRTLSSPRISSMNNQQATLTFAENFVYFELEVEQSEDTTSGNSSVTIDSSIHTVPVGVILNILPSIDLERNEVILNVRPTLTRISEFREDPGFALQAAQLGVSDLTAEVPVVDVRELDSVMRVRNGQVMVIGGLMEETSTNQDTGVPGLSKIPVLGNAFKSVQRLGSVVETVIFIKATIVPGEGVTAEDKEFYNKFSVDHQPLKF